MVLNYFINPNNFRLRRASSLTIYILVLLIIYNTKSNNYLYAVNVRFTLIRASCSGLRSGDAQFYNRGLKYWPWSICKLCKPITYLRYIMLCSIQHIYCINLTQTGYLHLWLIYIYIYVLLYVVYVLSIYVLY